MRFSKLLPNFHILFSFLNSYRLLKGGTEILKNCLSIKPYVVMLDLGTNREALGFFIFFKYDI